MTVSTSRTRNRPYERGAALISALLISLLILGAGGALILTTAMSATNAVDSTSETQAYYAAEAGLQRVLQVLRGNVAPSPLFVSNPSGGVADQNRISFRSAVDLTKSNLSGDASTRARLSRWLSYDSTYTDRVALTDNYSPLSGMAFGAVVSDPDNSARVIFSTSGVFDNNTTTKAFGGGGNRATLTYQPQATATINTSGTSTLGTFTISNQNGTFTLSNEPFTLTITQSSPWSAAAAIKCTLSGTITSTTSLVVITFPTVSNNLEGTTYARSGIAVNTNSTTRIQITVTAPEPRRLLVKVTGYGPRAAKKQMQLLLNRYAFDYQPASAVTLRGADFGMTPLTFAVGNSSQYTYSGYDNAGGANLPAFALTNSADYTAASTLVPSGSTQVKGTPALQQASISNLSELLRTANGARAAVSLLRELSQNQVPSRYFTTSSQPSDFGATSPNGLLTFVEGDADLPPSGGAGLLVVTGTLTMRGSTDFKGLILVLGAGQLVRDGGGNGNTYGSIVVAKFDATGDFLAPTFNTNGGGTSAVQYDSQWVRKALMSAGPRVLGVSEY